MHKTTAPLASGAAHCWAAPGKRIYSQVFPNKPTKYWTDKETNQPKHSITYTGKHPPHTLRRKCLRGKHIVEQAQYAHE